MRINDSLLSQIIEGDMRLKGVNSYHIVSDEIVLNPERIEVASNEVIFICSFSLRDTSRTNFEVKISSAIASFSYHPNVCRWINETGSTGEYESSESTQITRHWSSVSVNPLVSTTASFYLRVVRLNYQK